MPILKKIVMFPIATAAALGYFTHIFAMMLAGLFHRDEKRIAIAVYIESQKLLADQLARNME